MNIDNLNELIDRYESNLDIIYGEEHDELFKWRAMKTWRDEWFKPAESFPSFCERFTAAKKDFSLFIDNSRLHPSAGVLKLWEKEPKTVEHLFYDILFADANGNASLAQDHMDSFLESYEVLRQKYYPGNWSYKQDRHSASVYMAMNDPDFHYVYKSSEALTMAKYIDFGLDIGTGSSFSLENYYRMCDELVKVLKNHESLIQKHLGWLTASCYEDTSYHLLAFDLMYCCRTYDYYRDLTIPLTGKVRRKAVVDAQASEALANIEREWMARSEAIEREIEMLERSCDDFEEINLMGVQVTFSPYGVGTVIGQNINKITVRFNDVEKSFVLDKKYRARPHFEDDEDIVETFTAYGQTQEQITRLRRELESINRIHK